MSGSVPVKRRLRRWLAAGAVLAALGFGIYRVRGVPLVHHQERWSIGMYEGESPFRLRPMAGVENPVLTAADVADRKSRFVADPFLVKDGEAWYMFFEIIDEVTAATDISVATSADGKSWTYGQVVLDEPFDLSYPYVFRWRDRWYMVPESAKAGAVRLYEAVEFPQRWVYVKDLVRSERPVDPSPFHYHDHWWLLVETNPKGNDVLRLYHADDLLGPWSEHPQSPVVRGDGNIARPGGRVLVIDDVPYRFSQDCLPTYGNQVRAFAITELTPTTYREQPHPDNPIVAASGDGWNEMGMHQVDAYRLDGGRWIACVDGLDATAEFGLKY